MGEKLSFRGKDLEPTSRAQKRRGFAFAPSSEQAVRRAQRHNACSCQGEEAEATKPPLELAARQVPTTREAWACREAREPAESPTQRHALAQNGKKAARRFLAGVLEASEWVGQRPSTRATSPEVWLPSPCEPCSRPTFQGALRPDSLARFAPQRSSG